MFSLFRSFAGSAAFSFSAMAASLALAPIALVQPAIAAPAAWAVDQVSSGIGFSGTHAGNAFTGQFKRWKANIRFDPADLAHSQVVVAIDLASATTGDKFRDTTLREPEWFDSAKQPTATFVTRTIRAAGAGRYEADGVLTIKGKAVPVKLPFSLAIEGANAMMSGKATLDRTALDLGMKSDAKAAWVSKTIDLDVKVKATRR